MSRRFRVVGIAFCVAGLVSAWQGYRGPAMGLMLSTAIFCR